MKFETKLLGFVFLLSLVLVTVAVVLLSKNQGPSQTTTGDKVYQIDYSKGEKTGSDSAKIKLAEFSDYQCPACAAFAPAVADLISSNSANLQFYYFDFPLPQHQNAWAASNAAQSAGTLGKFWEMHEKLFATQTEWSSLTNPADFFANLASSLELDSNKIKDDISKNTYQNLIQAGLNEGNILQIDSTPTFFLNGKKLRPGTPDDLKIAVSAAF